MKTLTILLLSILCACAASEKEDAAPPPAGDVDEVQTAAEAPVAMEAVRVACVGDSITYGSGIKDRERDSYPAKLQQMLGDAWEVRNFGVSGATLLKKGNKPYWNEEAFQQALAFKPHKVIIKLGTNDAKPQNWEHKAEFIPDYEELIRRFADLETQPWIWICTPVPAYHEGHAISGSVVENEVVPEVKKVASETMRPLIDLHRALADRPYFFPDNVHPNAEGAAMMARAVYRELTGVEVELASQSP